jgi:hypothetical protein
LNGGSICTARTVPSVGPDMSPEQRPASWGSTVASAQLDNGISQARSQFHAFFCHGLVVLRAAKHWKFASRNRPQYQWRIEVIPVPVGNGCFASPALPESSLPRTDDMGVWGAVFVQRPSWLAADPHGRLSNNEATECTAIWQRPSLD